MVKIELALDDPKKHEGLREFAQEVMGFIFSKSQENLVKKRNIPGRPPAAISNTGFLLGSGVPPIWEGDKLVIRYTAPYAAFVEFGTEPHPMPPDVLVGWVRLKLGIGGKEGEKVARRISWKIQHHGTPPAPYLGPAVDAAVIKFGLKRK